MQRDLDALFEAFQKDPFRRKFRLSGRELAYVQTWGIDAVMKHGRDFIDKRIAPAFPPNDGRQTPWRNHPIFVAQHATATCCRGCLEKWHSIGKGQALTGEQIDYVLGVLRRWLLGQLKR